MQLRNHHCSVGSSLPVVWIIKLDLAGVACRQLLLMPVESEVAAFSGSADTGARKAAAVLVIQEAYRMYRHRQLVKVCALSRSDLHFCCLSREFTCVLTEGVLVATAQLVQ